MCAVYEYVRRLFIPKKQKQYIFMNLICNIILLVVFTLENRMFTIIVNATCCIYSREQNVYNHCKRQFSPRLSCFFLRVENLFPHKKMREKSTFAPM